MTDTATTATTTVDTYLAAYNETDAATRQTLLEQAFAADGRLVDPPLVGVGREGISEMMGVVHQQFPGHTFRRSSGIDEHHDHVRYGWELLDPDGNVALAGMDVGLLDDGGRLVHVAGFFGPLPELA
ncbi:MAG: nuclear transport factor 2 family protein [Acidimicrobiales bacterium]